MGGIFVCLRDQSTSVKLSGAREFQSAGIQRMIFQPRQVLFIVVFLIGSLVAGCSSTRQVPSSTAGPSELTRTQDQNRAKSTKTPALSFTATLPPTPTAEPHLDIQDQDLRGIKISFWHPWIGEPSTRLDAVVREFNRSNEWGITVVSQSYYSAGSLFDTVNASIDENEGGLPDVVAAPGDQLAVWSNNQDALVGLDGYINHPSYGLTEEELSAFRTDYLEQDKIGGAQISVPFLRSAYVLFYNQTWAEELGFDSPPATPLEFKEQACAAAIHNNSARVVDLYGTGGWIVDSSPLTFVSWIQSFGGEITAGEGYLFESQEAEDAVAFLRGMLDEGCAWVSRSQTPQEYFLSRKALYYSGSLQDIFYLQKLRQASGSKDQWTVLPYPRIDGSVFAYTNGYSIAIFKAKDSSAGKQAPNQQMAAWLFTRWLTSPENQASIAETFPSLPVNSASEPLFQRSGFPWKVIRELSEVVLPAPDGPSWRNVRRLVEDAGWQIFHLPGDQVGTILPEIDKSIREMLKED